MSSRKKIFFLIITFVIPLLIYSISYYSKVLERGQFKKEDFLNLHFLIKVNTNATFFFDAQKALIWDVNHKNNAQACTLNSQTTDDILTMASKQGLWNLDSDNKRASHQSDYSNQPVGYSEMIFFFKNKKVFYHKMQTQMRKHKKIASVYQAIEQKIVQSLEHCFQSTSTIIHYGLK